MKSRLKQCGVSEWADPQTKLSRKNKHSRIEKIKSVDSDWTEMQPRCLASCSGEPISATPITKREKIDERENGEE